jgi:class 3 adenylate cyclase
MTQLPTGDNTFLFTDIEGSTRLWEQDADAMRQALVRHDSLLRSVIGGCGGHVFKTTGDGFCAVFTNPWGAAEAALAAQRELQEGVLERVSASRAEGNGGGSGLQLSMTPLLHHSTALRVRMALHTGQAELRDGDYFGPALNRAARLMDAGHGGQILLSAAAQDALRGRLPAGAALKALGVHRLRDLQDPEHIFQLLHPELPGDFPPLRTVNAPWMAHHSQASRPMAPLWFSRPAPVASTPRQPTPDAAFWTR